ncbi:MAG: DUF3078 domain-containing protein [Bacteroidota bacterium]
MSKSLQALLILLVSTNTLFAQTDTIRTDTTYWRKSFAAGANLNQAAFSSNWKAGGVNSIALGLFANYKANYLKEKVSWDNDFQFQYGIIKNAGQDMRKSLDRIYLDSKYGYKISGQWNAFISGNFFSQFAKGYKYDVDATGNDLLISNFMSPGFLTFALGFEYRPTSWFSLRLSPFAPRFTFLSDQAVRPTPTDVVYGVPVGKSLRTEWLAAQIQADIDKDIAENLNLKVNYLGYANYETLALNTIDHRLSVMLTAKVNKFLSVNVNGIMLYDRDQDLSVQYSQSLALGLLYNIQNYTDKK